MSPVKGIVGAVSELVDRLTLPAREKKQLETDLLKVFVEWEQRVMEARTEVLTEEARGNWLQRSWRPLVMLTFALIVLVGTFTSLPILADTSRFWDLLEVGIGGYVMGRSGEKILQVFARKRRF
ncbi:MULTISPECIES: 3TM-type holin [Butyricimonas]|uniref:3TM-type holin n=1 Tax=Butyricimonas TaxID=574697 RepID=UPI001D07D691|nr:MULTISPECIES: 3TM-type holin [Butyricimonas]MCB6974366.1 holin family protein [Butyricimonas synergistica]MCG4521074.1 holin family protein [Butyricimonas sp. DFI.6.44]